MNIYEVIRQPIVSERAMALARDGKYTFEVAPEANKIQIKEAVETIFRVDVIKVNTVAIPGKKRRGWRRPIYGKTPKRKKAIVTIKPGQRIEFYEGV
ncbi:MAG: 50S ribosomal protein L23 [Chloroflexi bacterium]|nr:50S ribosomal protein L23 [Chloroflexota bacterium]MBU1750917.1 50S ribosomal protein L23 [Chloroflexota bacterium]MBU1878177.1 50S ribosomal protein L23 [Chloroflexota bacterium]